MGEGLFNLATAVRIVGPIDLRRLRSAVERVVSANATLRTRFPLRKGSRIWTVAESIEVSIGMQTVSFPGDVADVLHAEATLPFDLEHGPLIRWMLIALGGPHHILMLTADNFVADDRAIHVALDSVSIAYRDPVASLAPTVDSATESAGENDDVASACFDRARSYWHEQLIFVPDPPEFPSLGHHRSRQSGEHGTFELDLDEALTRGLRRLAQSCRTTPFVVFVAGVAATLSRLTGSSDLVIGTSVDKSASWRRHRHY